MKKSFLILGSIFALSVNAGNIIATFEETSITPTKADTVWRPAIIGLNEFQSGGYDFLVNVQDYGSYGMYYAGFAVSNNTNKEGTYSSAAGGAYKGNNFAVMYPDYYGHDSIIIPKDYEPVGFYINNTADVVNAIVNGDGMSDVAGGFTNEDWLKLTISGWNNGTLVNNVEFYLAKDGQYVKDWTWVDLSSLKDANALTFAMSGTKKNQNGLTTPTYFCIDNFTAEPVRTAKYIASFEEDDISPIKVDTVWRPAAIGLNNFQSGDYNFLVNVQDYGSYGMYYAGFAVSNSTSKEGTYSSAAGGAYKGNNFAVIYPDYYGHDSIIMPKDYEPVGFYINNTADVANAIVNGDGMSDVAGGFTNEDWFKLTISGWNNGTLVDNVEFYLAKDGQYVKDWTWVDLSSLKNANVLTFAMSGTKKNQNGLTTPTYFCMDNFTAEPVINTGIEEISTILYNTQKIIYQGNIYIKHNNKIYNIQGQCIK